MERNLNAAAIHLTNKVKEAIGEGQPPSQPWEPPHVETGHLRRNIAWDIPGPLRRRIGTGVGNAQSVGYALWLEFGTRKMLPRPFLRPTRYKEQGRLLGLLSVGMKKKVGLK